NSLLAPDPKEDAGGGNVFQLSGEFMGVWSTHRDTVSFHESPQALAEIDDGGVMTNCKIVDVGEEQSRLGTGGHFPPLPLALVPGIGKAPGLNRYARASVCDFPMLVIVRGQRPH